jgi:hypothetical protein
LGTGEKRKEAGSVSGSLERVIMGLQWDQFVLLTPSPSSSRLLTEQVQRKRKQILGFIQGWQFAAVASVKIQRQQWTAESKVDKANAESSGKLEVKSFL